MRFLRIKGRSLPFFIFYDTLFSLLFLMLYRYRDLYLFFAVCFWIGIVITLGEICLRTLSKYGFIKNLSYKFWLLFLTLSALENIFVFSQYKKENFIYFWDAQNYWTLSIKFSDQYFTHFVHAMKILYLSILNSDYNYLPSVLLSLPLKLFDHSYLVYALSVNNLYLLPALLLIALLIRKILVDLNLYTRLTAFCSISIPFLFTPFTIPLMRGYLDSAGLFFIALLLIFIYSSSFIHTDVERNLFFGLLMVLLLMTRRWYAYYIVALISIFGLSSVIRILVFDRGARWNHLIRYLLNMMMIGLECLLVLGIFFKTFLVRSLTGNYALAYSAWQNGNYIEKTMDAIQYIGLILFLFILAGAVYLFARRGKMFFFINLLLQTGVAYFLFNNVQNFGIHHYYLIAVPLCLLLTVGICLIVSERPQWVARLLFILVIFGVLIWNFGQTYYPAMAAARNTVLLSKATAYPRVRDDIAVIRQMVADLNRWTENNGKKVYVLASSATLNDGIVQRAYAPEALDAVPTLLKTNHVDLRDGFPDQFFQADFVVVAEPVQYHLRPSDQRVIGVLANAMLDRTFDNFSQVKTYQLQQNVTVRVFEKTEAFSKHDISYVHSSFEKYYKNNPDFD